MNTEPQAPLTPAEPPRFSIPWPARKVPLERLALLAGNLATCLSSGVAMPRALQTSCRALTSGRIAELFEEAIAEVESGHELSEAWQPLEPHLPPFFLPVLACGERTGRLDDTLRYLERQCRALAEPARKLREVWLYPLLILALGLVVEFLTVLASGAPLAILAFLVRSVLFYGGTLVACVAAYRTPETRLLIDRAKLAIPLFGPVERNLAINRFFHVLNLLYCTGGTRVEQMLQVASRAVTNLALRKDLLSSVAVIQRGGTIAQGLGAPECLSHEQKATILAGDEGGALEEAFDHISRQTADLVEEQLALLSKLCHRLLLPPLILALVLAIASLLRTLLGI